jgi:hypothetical protein
VACTGWSMRTSPSALTLHVELDLCHVRHAVQVHGGVKGLTYGRRLYQYGRERTEDVIPTEWLAERNGAFWYEPHGFAQASTIDFGRTSRTLAPPSGRLTAVAIPPCATAIVITIASPSPAPPSMRDRLESGRRKRSKA